MIATSTTTREKMNFIDWLEQELQERRWQKSDLAQAADMSHSAISLVLSGDRKPGPDLCNGIARAFGIPPETVFRQAGLLPALPGPEEDELVKKAVEAFKQLDIEKRREVLKYVMWQVQQSRLADTPGLEGNEGGQRF